MQHDLQLRAAARVHYDEDHFLISPVSFDAAERLRTLGWRDAVEAALEEQAAVAERRAATAQLSFL